MNSSVGSAAPAHHYNNNGSHGPHSVIKDEEEEEDDMLNDDDDTNDSESYKPRPQLPQPYVVMRSLAHLIKDLDLGLIDIDPDYQREVVWTADRMTGLINSLMENFYIPPIILNKKTIGAETNSASDSIHVCVDGKQRLSSVRAFVKGMIPCHDHIGEKWWFCSTPASRRRKVFSEETQKLFLRKEFVSFEFKDLSPDQEEDLFARVQMGVSLSLAEKMRASTGPWQELAKLFVDDFPTIYSLLKDTARAKDFQLTLSCFSQILEVMHPTAANGVPGLKTNHVALPKLLSNKDAVNDATKAHLARVWNVFKDLLQRDLDVFTNSSKYLHGVQTFAPVEMVAVTVLISMYSESRNNQLLLGDIKALREAIREHFKDIRMHSQMWKFIWDYLENLEAIRGAVDGSTVPRNTQPTRFTARSKGPALNSPTSPPPMTGSSKRGRSTAKMKAKPLTILPPRNSTPIKKESEEIPSPSQPRQFKRKRVDAPEDTRPLLNDFTPTSPVPVPFEEEQNSTVELNSCEEATSLMKSLAAAARMQHGPPHQIPSNNLSGTASFDTTPHRPGIHISPLRTSVGAFAPQHTEQQWAGELRSSTPPHEKPRPSITQPKSRISRKTRNAFQNSVLASEIIDLTSDTEQERRSLLATFKTTNVGVRRQESARPPETGSFVDLDGVEDVKEIPETNANVRS